MSLHLVNSKDQALLAMVVQEAAKVVAAKKGFLGRTALQKIMYFLKVLNVPMGYRFDIHYYGPFCQGILIDADWLLADRVIVDQSDKPEKYSNYAPGKTFAELLAVHGSAIEQYRGRVQTIVNVLAPMRPENLELFATLDYLYRELRATGGKGPWERRVIKKFMDIKRNKFSRRKVTEAYMRMIKAHLVDP